MTIKIYHKTSSLKHLLLLLLLTAGASGAWGQTITDGLYYITSGGNNNTYDQIVYDPDAPTTNYYLCPTENWYYYKSTSPYYQDSPDNGMPFMTTYQCRNGVYDFKKALWCIQKIGETDHYYIIHVIDGKYLTYNSTMGSSSNAGRMRFHLESSPGANNASEFLFTYVAETGTYDITTVKENSRKYMNVSGGNQPSLQATHTKYDGPKTDGTTAIDVGGTIGLWTAGSSSDQNSRWIPESTLLAAPAISVDKDNNTFTITDTNGLSAGYTIRYTTGDGSQAAPTASTGVEYDDTPVIITEAWTVKAVVVRYGVVLTEVATQSMVPATQCDAPTLIYNHAGKTVTITSTWPTDATIYYSLNAVGTPDQEYTGPITIADNCDIVRAIAVKAGLDNSSVASISRVESPTLVFDDATQSVTISCATDGATIHYTTDGGTPTAGSTEYSGAIVLTSGTTVKAIAVKDGYIYSNVVENTYTQTAAPTIAFDQYTNTFTVSAATGATIHYTTDGTDPTTSSATYSSAVSLTSAATIKALAAKSGEVYSTITSKVIGKSNTPVISFSGDDEITITTDPSGVELRYTTDGTDPTNASALYSSSFVLTATQDVVKAIVYETDKVSSDVATLTVIVHMGASYPYLIQSKEFNYYYMIPNLSTETSNDSQDRLTTNSLARPSMQWYFENAGMDNGVQYYYIKNLATGSPQYIYFLSSDNTIRWYDGKVTTDAIVDDAYKFSLIESTYGGYTIRPKLSQNRWLRKGGGSKSNSNIAAANYDEAQGYTRWSFIKYNGSVPNTAAPITASAEGSYQYYKIASEAEPTYYIVTPTSPATVVTTTTTESKSTIWYFEEATHDDWLAYYYIKNAQSDEYLYLNKTGSDALAMGTTPTNDERYHFAIAKSTTGAIYIVPRSIKYDGARVYFSLSKKSNGYNIWTASARYWNDTNGNDNVIKWNISPATFKCDDPVVTYNDVNDQIVINSPNKADIYYNTNGDANTSSTKYTGPIENNGSTQVIKAICARRADGTDKSDAVTIIFNPTITLSTGSTITYDGSSHQPTISSAAYNSTNITSECTVAKYLDEDGNVVSECINAGVYTVVITDEDGGDYYVYGSTTFTINKADISPNVTIANWSYGDAASNPIVTGNDGEGVVTYEYKPQVAADGDYSTTVPEAAGNYTIRATIAASANYNGGSATATFTISPKSLGDGTPAPNITCDLMETNGTYSIVVKQGETKTLTAGTSGTGYDYSTGEPTEDNDKYYAVTVTGANNYTGYFSVRLAKIQLSKRTGSVAPGGAALFVSDEHDGDFVVPDNMTAYIVTGIDGNTLVTEQLDNIPDHVPVLLVSTIDANGFLVQPEASATPPSSTNLLVEATGDTAARTFGTAQIYLLYKGEFVLNAAGTLPAGKIYLPRSSSAPAPVKLYIDWDFVDGIDLEKEELRVENEEYYTLDGIKLGCKPIRKGLYIINGRKVVIK